MQLTAIDQARAMCARYGVRDFEKDLQDHLRAGFVYATPDLLLMAKPVPLDDGRPAWLVYYAAGELVRLLHAFPFELPRLAIHRHRDLRLRVYSLRRMKRLALAFYRRSQAQQHP